MRRKSLSKGEEPLFDQLLLSAEERLDYKTFASPGSKHWLIFPDKGIPQQTIVQTPILAQSQVNPQVTT